LELFPEDFVSKSRMNRLIKILLAAGVIFLIASCDEDEVIYNNGFSVIEYTPAPGQYINGKGAAGFNGEKSKEEAVEYANNRLSGGLWISLGGFGGYVIGMFDFPVENDGGYNISITGNAVKGSSEPGIVWVMEDKNGNNIPDDTWYRLRGSEESDEKITKDYAVTYFRPEQPSSPVAWSDNLGNSGSIDYLSAYHNQDFYYPEWIEAGSYTLTGVCVAFTSYVDEYGNYMSEDFEWGYADNYSEIDRLVSEPGKSVNLFKIDNAVDEDGNHIKLDRINFVKIQTGVNAKSGWLGEVSTEIFAVNDYNMVK
jgi:hypothetical protein